MERTRSVAILLVVAVCVLCATSAFAQMGRFGKNKVTYTSPDWQQFETKHFRIYLPKNGFGDAEDLYRWGSIISEMAEHGYEQAKDLHGIDLHVRPNLVIFPTHSLFEQTHMQPGFIPQGVGAFAEPLGMNIAFPLGRNLEHVQDVMTHEIEHIFEYQYFWPHGDLGRMFSANAPGWVMEGLANYVAKRSSTYDAMLLMDLARKDNIPTLTQMSVNSGYLVDYVLGRVVWEVMEKHFGKKGVRSYLEALRNARQWRVHEILTETLGVSVSEFSTLLRAEIRERYVETALQRDSVEDIATSIVADVSSYPTAFVEERLGSGLMFFSPAVSPDGRLIAAFAIDWHRRDLDIVLLSAEDGSFLRNLTPGYPGAYEYLIAQGATVDIRGGTDLTFSPDGRFLAFMGRFENYRRLFVMDVETGEIVRRRDLRAFATSPANPAFAPDGDRIAFRATRELQSDVWVWSLNDDTLTNVTQDASWDYAPVWRDDNTLLYLSDRQGYKKVVEVSLRTGEQTQRTVGASDEVHIAASWTSDRVVVVSDRDETYNLYLLDTENSELTQLTNVLTGVLTPSFVPSQGGDDREGEAVVFTAMSDQGFTPYRMRIAESRGTVRPIRGFAPSLPERKQERPASFLLPGSIEPAETELAFRLGSFAGGVSTAFGTQVLSNVSFAFVEEPFRNQYHVVRLQSYGTLSSYMYAYGNQSRRWNWGVTAWRQQVQGLTFDPLNQEFDREVLYRDTGAAVSLSYPFSMWRRIEASLRFEHRSYGFGNVRLSSPIIAARFQNGSAVRATIAFVNDTVRFKRFGPYWGLQLRADLGGALPLGDALLQSTDVRVGVRRYFPVTPQSLIAVRFEGFASMGTNPRTEFFGGHDQVRGFRYWEFSGTHGGFLNLEYRFPIMDRLGLGPLRGRLFGDFAGAFFDDAFAADESFFGPRGLQHAYGGGIRTFIPLSVGGAGRVLPLDLYYVRPMNRFTVVIGAEW